MTRVVLPSLLPHQRAKRDARARFKLWVAGRRSRKSSTALVCAIDGHGLDREFPGALQGANVWWCCPSFRQGTSAWRAIRGVLAPIAIEVSEAERRVLLPGGGAITVRSADSGASASLVGDLRGIDGVVLDEAAQLDPAVWFTSILPALSDRKAWAFFATTPRGYNWLKSVFDAAQNLDDWQTWREPSTVNEAFDAREIERAIAAGMPRATAAQEFYAEWIDGASGRTFYRFDRNAHVREVEYSPLAPLALCLSFKRDPVTALVVQGDGKTFEHVLAELLPATPSARDVAAAFVKRFPRHADGRNLTILGDVTPGRDGRMSTGSSDFEPFRALLPRARLHLHFRERREKDLANLVNAVLLGPPMAPGAPAFVGISPSCVRLIADLEETENRPESHAIERGSGSHALAWAHRQAELYPFGYPRWATEGRVEAEGIA